MTKTLNPNSPLHFLPKELEKKQLMLYDSLRFTLEMLDYNFTQLQLHLESLSKGQANKIHYKLFNYAWGLIDHAQRFYLLYKKLNLPKNGIIERINYLYRFRNAIQHLNKNIEKPILENNRPIYGTLKWVVNDEEKSEVYTSLLVSGILNRGDIEFEHHSSSGYTHFINNIRLETDTKGKENNNEINLSTLIQDISLITSQIDDNLKKLFNKLNLQPLDWKSVKDVVLKMKNPTNVKG